jgi:hypothetical protein
MSSAPILVTKKDLKRGAWQYLKPILMIALSLPVLYILSAGPVGWAWEKFALYKFDAPTHVAQLFYSPLLRLYTSDSLAGRLYKGYMDFWLGRPKAVNLAGPKIN